MKSTVNNQTGTLDSTKYADIAFLEAIGHHNQREDSLALQTFHDGTRLWNGTGFKDNAFRSTFATYKIALLLYTARLLGQTIDSSVVDGLLALQSHSGVDSGGFLTEYDGRFAPASGSNTETTALAILALSQPDVMLPADRLLLAAILLSFAAVLILADRSKSLALRLKTKTIRLSKVE